MKSGPISIVTIVCLVVVLALTFWLARVNNAEYQSTMQTLKDSVAHYEERQQDLREMIVLLEEQDSINREIILELNLKSDELEASRKWWFEEHQRIRDNAQSLTISEQQEYWTKRYPPGQQPVDSGNN
jgi:hypothetical protein